MVWWRRDNTSVAGALTQEAAAGRHEAGSSEEEQVEDLHQLLQLYKDEREQLSKDVLFYKHSCKDLKRRLRTEVGFIVYFVLNPSV